MPQLFGRVIGAFFFESEVYSARPSASTGLVSEEDVANIRIRFAIRYDRLS